MKDVIIREKDKVMSIIEPINMVYLFLEELPRTVKLINGKTRFNMRKSWTQAQTDKSLKIKSLR